MNLSEIVTDLRQGMIPADVYSDPDLFDLEQKRLFGRAWMFLAHESEIPEPGDYVVRRIVHDSFIVSRGEDGGVQVLFNMCLHRGMQVCRSERGNSSHFRCPYHAWTYKNSGELVGVPFHKDAYGGEDNLERKGRTLLPAPRVDSYAGMIFASLDPAAPDLDDYLGGMRFYLDFYLRQSPAGMEFHGPQRFRVRANWKTAADNFAGDSYHTPHTHSSIVDIGLFRAPKAHKRKEGANWWCEVGGGTSYKLPTGDFDENMRHLGYPPEMVETIRSMWSPAQRQLAGEAGFMLSAASVAPNLAFVHNWPQVDSDGLIAPFITVRLWQPVGTFETEILSWFAVDRSAPQWFKDASRKACTMCFGSSGMFEQDDVENWSSITQVAHGEMATRLKLNNRMGLDRQGQPIREPLATWPGPGYAHVGFGEFNQRDWWSLYADYIEAEPGGSEASRPRMAAIG